MNNLFYDFSHIHTSTSFPSDLVLNREFSLFTHSMAAIKSHSISFPAPNEWGYDWNYRSDYPPITDAVFPSVRESLTINYLPDHDSAMKDLKSFLAKSFRRFATKIKPGSGLILLVYFDYGYESIQTVECRIERRCKRPVDRPWHNKRNTGKVLRLIDRDWNQHLNSCTITMVAAATYDLTCVSCIIMLCF